MVCVDRGTCDDGATDVESRERHGPAVEEEELFGLGQHRSPSVSSLSCVVFLLFVCAFVFVVFVACVVFVALCF